MRNPGFSCGNVSAPLWTLLPPRQRAPFPSSTEGSHSSRWHQGWGVGGPGHRYCSCGNCVWIPGTGGAMEEAAQGSGTRYCTQAPPVWLEDCGNLHTLPKLSSL